MKGSHTTVDLTQNVDKYKSYEVHKLLKKASYHKHIEQLNKLRLDRNSIDKMCYLKPL